jgi:ATP-dependent Clp protease protease subunit
MPVSTTLNARVPVVRLTDAIDMAAAYALVDEIALLHDYYQFRTIDLHIDSPGGETDALHHIVQSLEPWRKGEGRTLRTLGLNQVASAAALLLSFGTIGHRAATAHSRLLYHSVRCINREGLIETVADLRKTSRQLEQWDKRFLDLLSEHSLHGEGDAIDHKRKLRRLLRQDRFLTPGQALDLKLIDRVVQP